MMSQKHLGIRAIRGLTLLLLLTTPVMATACDQLGIGVESATTTETAMFRANPQRTGVYDTPGLAVYESTKWRFQAEDWIFGAPAIVGDTVIVGSYDSNVYALDRETGMEKWQFKTGDSVLASPAASESLVFIASLDSNIYALDIETGALEWQVAGSGVYSGSPAVVGNTLYIASDSGLLLALDTESGAERWRFETLDDPMPYSVAIDAGIVYTIAGSATLFALDASSGETLWQYNAAENLADRYSPTASPVVGEGVIYLTLTNIDSETVIQAVDFETRTAKWQHKSQAESFSAPSLAGTRLVYGSLDGHIYGLEAETGELIWDLPTNGIIFSAAAVTDNTVYIGSADNYLYALDASTGLVLWRFLAGGGVSSPAIADRVIYVGDDSGMLFAIR